MKGLLYEGTMKNIQKILTLVFVMTVLVSCNKPSSDKREVSVKVNKHKEAQSKPITALKTKIKKLPKPKVNQNYEKQLDNAKNLIEAKKYKEALKIIRPMAEDGNPEASSTAEGEAKVRATLFLKFLLTPLW